MDAAAAALDARHLQTFANTGDCAARVNRNPGVDQHVGTSTLLIFIIRPTEQTHNPRTNHAQFERDQTRNARDTRHTHRPPHHAVARCCATSCRRPSAASAASASLSPPRSSCCRSLASPCVHGETLLCGSHHVVVRRLEKTWDLEGNVACGV